MFREALERARKSLGPKDPRLSGFMAPLGQSLIEAGRNGLDAEPVLRECMAIREKAPGPTTGAFLQHPQLARRQQLLGQKKFAAGRAASVLSGYLRGLKAREARIPPQGKPRLKEAAERVVKLYGGGTWEKKDKAADWRAGRWRGPRKLWTLSGATHSRSMSISGRTEFIPFVRSVRASNATGW